MRYAIDVDLIAAVEVNSIAECIVVDHDRDRIRYFANNDSTTRSLLERILADEEDHVNDVHDLVVAHEGKPMLCATEASRRHRACVLACRGPERDVEGQVVLDVPPHGRSVAGVLSLRGTSARDDVVPARAGAVPFGHSHRSAAERREIALAARIDEGIRVELARAAVVWTVTLHSRSPSRVAATSIVQSSAAAFEAPPTQSRANVTASDPSR